MRDWIRLRGRATICVELCPPLENSWAESLNGRVRDGLPDTTEFTPLPEAKSLTEDWKNEH